MNLQTGFNEKMSMETFKSLYFDYAKELGRYKNRILTDSDIQKQIECITESISAGDSVIYPLDDIGFVLVGANENKHPLYQYYIEETYIKPEYRRKHLMRSHISRILDNFTGTGTLYILDRNDTGKKFWKSIGRLIQLNDDFDICPDATQYMLVRY